MSNSITVLKNEMAVKKEKDFLKFAKKKHWKELGVVYVAKATIGVTIK